jgi:hypothetical protein
MADRIIEVADGCWNIRGSFKVAGVLDVGTQCSLVRLQSGEFVLLDAYTLKGRVKRQVDELTNGGADIKAILNLHPFHTLHVLAMHKAYPGAFLYGTPRHFMKFPELPWQPQGTQQAAIHKLFGADFEFSVPAGVDFISGDEKVHFSSVLAYHPASKTIHSDDTLMYLELPWLARALGLGDSVSFHPTLARALQKRPGAAAEFRQWANNMIDKWQAAENLCAAHTAALLARENTGAPLHERMLSALEKVEKTLAQHEAEFG